MGGFVIPLWLCCVLRVPGGFRHPRNARRISVIMWQKRGFHSVIPLISTSQRTMDRARVLELGGWIITPCSSHHKDMSDGSWNNRRLFTRISRWHVLRSSSIRWRFLMSRGVKNVPKNHDCWHSEESRPGKVPGERSGLAIPRRALGRQPEKHHQESRLCSGPCFLCGPICGAHQPTTFGVQSLLFVGILVLYDQPRRVFSFS